jgi:hypothetical protein
MRELWETSVRVPLPHQAPRILDVGCGSGIWAKEVAEVLPRAQIVGVDLSPTFLLDEPGRPIPENLSFEVLSLPSSFSQFPDDCKRSTTSISDSNTQIPVSISSPAASLLVGSQTGIAQSPKCIASLSQRGQAGFKSLNFVRHFAVTIIPSLPTPHQRPGQTSFSSRGQSETHLGQRNSITLPPC